MFSPLPHSRPRSSIHWRGRWRSENGIKKGSLCSWGGYRVLASEAKAKARTKQTQQKKSVEELDRKGHQETRRLNQIGTRCNFKICACFLSNLGHLCPYLHFTVWHSVTSSEHLGWREQWHSSTERRASGNNKAKCFLKKAVDVSDSSMTAFIHIRSRLLAWLEGNKSEKNVKLL